MAGVQAPLFGLGASGSIAKTLVFSTWRGRAYVRRHAIPSNPRTGLQVGMRASMKFVTQWWKNLTTAEQESWAAQAAVTNITLLNASVAWNQRETRKNLGVWEEADSVAGTVNDQPLIDSVTAQPKTLVLAWTAGGTPPEYTWYLYRSKTTGFTADVSNLVAIVNPAILTYTDVGLETGTEYFYLLNGGTKMGEFGAVSLQDSGTPT